MSEKCPRCGGDEVSGGYLSCSGCGKEWNPGESGDFKRGTIGAQVEAWLDAGDLLAVVTALKAACADKAALIKAGLQDGASSPELGRKWKAAEKKLAELARWAAEAGL
jgi:hypothetical protein